MSLVVGRVIRREDREGVVLQPNISHRRQHRPDTRVEPREGEGVVAVAESGQRADSGGHWHWLLPRSPLVGGPNESLGGDIGGRAHGGTLRQYLVAVGAPQAAGCVPWVGLERDQHLGVVRKGPADVRKEGPSPRLGHECARALGNPLEVVIEHGRGQDMLLRVQVVDVQALRHVEATSSHVRLNGTVLPQYAPLDALPLGRRRADDARTLGGCDTHRRVAQVPLAKYARCVSALAQ